MISVIIPNYNKSKFISETIKSVKSQSFLNWECIIIDDNSNDDSLKIIKNEIINDNRFHLFKNSENLGASYCRNLGIKESKGEHIIFLDADDILVEFCLENRYKELKNNAKIDFLIFPMGTFYKEIGDSSSVWNNFNGNHLNKFLSHNLPWHTMMVMWRKKTLEKLGGFQESFPRCQDVELHTRALLNHSFKYKFINGLIDCFFRINQDRINDYYQFLLKDINGKKMYFKYFSNIIKDSKKKFLKGTIYESYLITHYTFKIKKINLIEYNLCLNKLEQDFEIKDLDFFERIILKILKLFCLCNLDFRGTHKLLKFFFIR